MRAVSIFKVPENKVRYSDWEELVMSLDLYGQTWCMEVDLDMLNEWEHDEFLPDVTKYLREHYFTDSAEPVLLYQT